VHELGAGASVWDTLSRESETVRTAMKLAVAHEVGLSRLGVGVPVALSPMTLKGAEAESEARTLEPISVSDPVMLTLTLTPSAAAPAPPSKQKQEQEQEQEQKGASPLKAFVVAVVEGASFLADSVALTEVTGAHSSQVQARWDALRSQDRARLAEIHKWVAASPADTTSDLGRDVLRGFIRSDAVPALLRLAATRPAKRTAVTDEELLAMQATLNAYGSQQDAGAIREVMRGAAVGLAAVARSAEDAHATLRIADETEAEGWEAVLLAHATVMAFQMLRDVGVGGFTSGVVGLLLRRLAAKAAFGADALTLEEEDAKVDEQREKDKERKIRIHERMSEEDKAYLREVRKIKEVDWDQLERAQEAAEFEGVDYEDDEAKKNALEKAMPDPALEKDADADEGAAYWTDFGDGDGDDHGDGEMEGADA
jgi:hypothetical protein